MGRCWPVLRCIVIYVSTTAGAREGWQERREAAEGWRGHLGRAAGGQEVAGQISGALQVHHIVSVMEFVTSVSPDLAQRGP